MFPTLAITAAILTPDPLVVEGRMLRAQAPPPFTMRIPANPTLAEMREYNQALQKHTEAQLKYTRDVLEHGERGSERARAILKAHREKLEQEKQEKEKQEKEKQEKPAPLKPKP